jgi:hypothetical protein
MVTKSHWLPGRDAFFLSSGHEVNNTEAETANTNPSTWAMIS